MNEYIIAKYIRLSIEDEKTESMSITHQRLMLDKYIDELNIPNVTVLEFVDNGHSGTNMERPALQKMLGLVRSGKINCIVVKDFSRFSRNAMDSGYFIEQVFPLYKVRFISAADHYDANDYKNDTGGIDIAFKFLMHEYYSADISRKVKSAKRIQMARGENIVANALYGYHKNALGRWEPDPEAAEVVRKIFRMTLDGNSTAQIRDKLCAERIPTPKEYKERKRGKVIDPQCLWTTRMIRHVLENEQYSGTYIAGKQAQKAIGSHSKAWIDKSDWIRIPDNHPPIISKEDFTAAGTLISRYKGATMVKPTGNLLQNDIDCPRRSHRISGERLQGNAIYGYIKDESGKLAIDPAAARVIQEMYQWAATGLSVKEIRDKLTDSGHPVPSEHIRLNRGYEITPKNQWTAKCVRGILQNAQYTGADVAGKIRKPAIVSEALFVKVKEAFVNGGANRKNLRPRDYLLRGNIVKCGCCGYAMMYDDTVNTAVYRCRHTLADPNAKCHKLKCNALKLDAVVVAIIRKQAEVVFNTENLSALKKRSTDVRRIADYEREIQACVEQRQQTYERFVSHEIDRETHQLLRKDFAERLDRLQRQITMLKQTGYGRLTGQQVVAIPKDTLNEAATPREMIETLVDKILIGPDKRVEIQWKIVGFTNAVSDLFFA